MSKLKIILKSYLPPLIASIVGSIFMAIKKVDYAAIVKPKFAPPGIAFPIIWTFLYILVGTSTFIYLLRSQQLEEEKGKSVAIFYIDMFVNAFWTFFYFYLGLFLFSCFWLGFLIIICCSRMYLYWKGNRLSSLLNIPYLIWLIIAISLNISTFLLN